MSDEVPRESNVTRMWPRPAPPSTDEILEAWLDLGERQDELGERIEALGEAILALKDELDRRRRRGWRWWR